MVTKIVLREITICTQDQIKAVREIRNQESVRKSMYTEHEITLNEHLSWLEQLQSDKSQIVFVVLMDGKVSGIVSVNEIDRLHLKSDWAFYLDANARGGLGSVLEFNLINFVFDELGLEKLNCEVIETNEVIINLHKKFGFVEEGLRRENIIKNQNRIGVCFLGLTKSDWLRHKETIMIKYETAMKKFDLEIEYEPS